MKHIFVYGSLLKGLHNNPILGDSKRVKEAVTLPKYRLLDLGSFPGLLENGSVAVAGEVYEVNERVADSVDMLEGIDEENPENGLYRKVKIELEGGEEIDGYVFNTSHYGDNYPEVESGNWKEYFLEKTK